MVTGAPEPGTPFDGRHDERPTEPGEPAVAAGAATEAARPRAPSVGRAAGRSAGHVGRAAGRSARDVGRAATAAVAGVLGPVRRRVEGPRSRRGADRRGLPRAGAP